MGFAMNWKVRAFGFVLVATIGGVDFAVSETSNFNNPTIRGQRLDFCRHFGNACGKPAADLFCVENGFVEAQRFVIDQNIGARGINTLVFGDGRLCQGPNCSGFRVIMCTRPDKTPAPVFAAPPITAQPIRPVSPAPPATMVAPLQPTPPRPPVTMVPPVQPAAPVPPTLTVPPTLKAPNTNVVRPTVPIPPIGQVQPDRDPPIVRRPSGPPSISAGPIKSNIVLPAGASLVRCLGTGCEFAVTFEFDIDPKAITQSEYFVGNVEKIAFAGGFRWQVAKQPFPASGTGNYLKPPGLLASGNEAGPSRGFSIDFKKIVNPSQGRRLPIEKLFVRILPIAKPSGDVIVGQPSNAIGVFYDSVPPPQAPFTIYDTSPPHLFSVKVKSFTPPIFQRASRWGCVVIKGYKSPVAGLVEQMFPLNAEMCPKSYRGEGTQITSFGDFVDWAFGGVTDAVDWVSERYEDLKQLAVDITMKYTFFGAQCVFIASKIDSGATGYCRVMAETAVSSGMVALGIPPSIPNYNELIDKGVTHAVEIAAAEITEQTGVPCIGPCEDALRAGFSQAGDELKTSSYTPGCVGEDEAHKRGREPLCLPDFVIAKPAPGAVYTPATASVEVTRLFADKDPENLFDDKCWLGVGFSVENQFAGGTVWGPFGDTKEVPAQEIKGTLFAGNGAELSQAMPKGSKLVRNVIFQPPQKFIFPWTRQLWNRSQIPARDAQGPMGPDWFTLYSGGVAKVGASINCAQSSDTLTVQLPRL